MFPSGLAVAAGQASSTVTPAFPISFPRYAERCPAGTPLPPPHPFAEHSSDGGGKWGEGQGGIGEFIFHQVLSGQRTKPF